MRRLSLFLFITLLPIPQEVAAHGDFSQGAMEAGTYMVPGTMLFSFFFFLLFLLLFGGLIWLLFRQREEAHRKDSALQIARERYAKGEITKEEYEEIRKELTKA